MNKAELIAKLADDAGITKTQANSSLDSFVEAVTKTLKGGGKVTLVGFGTFSGSKRQARNGRNPVGRPIPLIGHVAALTGLAALWSVPICIVRPRRERPASLAGAEGATAPETLRQKDRVALTTSGKRR